MQKSLESLNAQFSFALKKCENGNFQHEDFLLLLTVLLLAKFGMLKIENETKPAFSGTQIVSGTKS